MLTIRSMSAGSIYHIYDGASSEEGLIFSQPIPDGYPTEIGIPDPDLGIMVPAPHRSTHMMDFDTSFYRSVKDVNGRHLNPVYHTKMNGTIDLSTPDLETTTLYGYSVYKVPGLYWTMTDNLDTWVGITVAARNWWFDAKGFSSFSSDTLNYVVVDAAITLGIGDTWGQLYTYVIGCNPEGRFEKRFYLGGWSQGVSDWPEPPWDDVYAFIAKMRKPGQIRLIADVGCASYDISPAKVVSLLSPLEKQLREETLRTFSTDIQTTFSKACTQALEDARFVHANQLEFWKDVAQTFSEVGAFQKLANTLADVVTDHPALKRYAREQFVRLEKFKTGEELVDNLAYDKFLRWTDAQVGVSEAKRVAKATGDAYLGTYYGTRLAMSDIEEISKGIADFVWRYYSEFRKAARLAHKVANFDRLFHLPGQADTESHIECNYTLSFNPYQGISEIRQLQEELGWGFNFHQIWECIPLSFVLDWAVSVSDILKAFDYDAYLQKLAINYEQLSYQIVTDVSAYVARRLGISDSQCVVTHTTYRRWYSTYPTVIPTAIDIFGQPQKHWLQGLALVVSRG